MRIFKWEEIKILRCSLASSTHKAFLTCLNKFHEFVSKYNLKKNLASARYTTATFIGYLYMFRRSYRTVTLYIKVLSCFHKIIDYQDTTKLFVVNKSLKARAAHIGLGNLRNKSHHINYFPKLFNLYPTYVTLPKSPHCFQQHSPSFISAC